MELIDLYSIHVIINIIFQLYQESSTKPSLNIYKIYIYRKIENQRYQKSSFSLISLRNDPSIDHFTFKLLQITRNIRHLTNTALFSMDRLYFLYSGFYVIVQTYVILLVYYYVTGVDIVDLGLGFCGFVVSLFRFGIRCSPGWYIHFVIPYSTILFSLINNHLLLAISLFNSNLSITLIAHSHTDDRFTFGISMDISRLRASFPLLILERIFVSIIVHNYATLSIILFFMNKVTLEPELWNMHF